MSKPKEILRGLPWYMLLRASAADSVGLVQCSDIYQATRKISFRDLLLKGFIFCFIGFLSFIVCKPNISLADEVIDYSVYDNLLQKYVVDGKVDYLRWKKEDYSIFETYISSIGTADISGLDEDVRKAFWINAYNALTIYAVMERLPEDPASAAKFSVRKVSGFFDRVKFKIAGEELTLNDIENIKLRAGFNDPRIHFSIVCASTSCPELINGAYYPDNLDNTLDERARIFFGDKTKNRLDKEKNIIYLSKIFTWFKEDFTNNAGSVLDYLMKYINEENARYIKDNKVAMKSLSYDWRVNIK